MSSIFKRVSDIINANLNDLLDRMEDPERIIKQIIREMEDNIRQAKEGVINAIASEKQLFRELEKHRKHSGEWLAKAETALKADKKNLALPHWPPKNNRSSVIWHLLGHRLNRPVIV